MTPLNETEILRQRKSQINSKSVVSSLLSCWVCLQSPSFSYGTSSSGKLHLTLNDDVIVEASDPRLTSPALNSSQKLLMALSSPPIFSNPCASVPLDCCHWASEKNFRLFDPIYKRPEIEIEVESNVPEPDRSADP